MEWESREREGVGKGEIPVPMKNNTNNFKKLKKKIECMTHLKYF